MQVLTLTEHDFLTLKERQLDILISITMGYFDGLHRGHQELFNQTITYAKAHNTASSILTFDFSQVAQMKKRNKHLLTEEETRALLADMGIEYYIVIHFGDNVKNMEPDAYIKQLCTLFNIASITVGEDFHFGKNRKGDVNTLKTLATTFNYELKVIPTVVAVAEKISSSNIESLIQEGQIETANELLGYPYEISGKVVHGAQQGHLLGFPTANMVVPEYKIVPPNGVYIVRVISNGKLYDGVTNIGIAPTVKNVKDRVIETNIFDFDADIYGQDLKVIFYKMIRDEKKFAGLDALKEQLAKDVKVSKAFLNNK